MICDLPESVDSGVVLVVFWVSTADGLEKTVCPLIWTSA
jgi:hypothetical protein